MLNFLNSFYIFFNFYFFFLKNYKLPRIRLLSCHVVVYNYDTW